MESPAESVREQPAMPRFEDGSVNPRELMRRIAEDIVNAIMDAEADQLCAGGANSRNGYRERSLVTCVGDITMRIPKLKSDSFFSEDVIERYQRVDRTVVSAVVEMYATGTSTRKVQRIAEKLGISRTPYKALTKTGEDGELSLELLVNEDNFARVQTAQAIATQLASCGITLTVTSLSFEDYSSRIARGNYDLYLGEMKLLSNMSLIPLLAEGTESRTAYEGFRSGSEDLKSFLSVFASEMPVIPVLILLTLTMGILLYLTIHKPT